MSDQPISDEQHPERFKADMPEIPGVERAHPSSNPGVFLAIGLFAILLVAFLCVRLLFVPKHAEPQSAPTQPPQIDVPAPPPDPAAAMPHATEANPGIATTNEMAKPWSSKDFFFKDRLTGENVSAILIRLPGGSPTKGSAYWAFVVKSPYGDCKLEYITDMEKLKTDYGYKAAKHPMVGNPCSSTLFEPLKMTQIPGDIWVRGAIVQGSDLRPPLGIEIEIRGTNILATRME